MSISIQLSYESKGIDHHFCQEADIKLSQSSMNYILNVFLGKAKENISSSVSRGFDTEVVKSDQISCSRMPCACQPGLCQHPNHDEGHRMSPIDNALP